MNINTTVSYSLNINITSKTANNEKPTWNGKKPYKYLEDFNDAAMSYQKKAKIYYMNRTESDGTLTISDLKKQIKELFPDYTFTNQNRKDVVRGANYLYISDRQLQKMANDPSYRGRVYGLMDEELTVSKEFTLTYSDGKNVTQHCIGSFFSLDESNGEGIDGLPYLGGCMTDGGFSSTESHPQVRNQSFIYDHLDPKKPNNKARKTSAVKSMAEKTAKTRADKKRAERKANVKKVVDNRQEAIETYGLLDSDSTAYYDRSILQPERRDELLERMLSSMSKAEHSEKIVEYDEELGREIYAFSIYDGKVHISGNEGFEYKAMTYEKLVNASLNKSWNCLFKGSIVGESKLIDTVNGILKYYMDIDSDYRRNNKSDSITNHVDEAFEKWCDDHKQKEFHFDGRA